MKLNIIDLYYDRGLWYQSTKKLENKMSKINLLLLSLILLPVLSFAENSTDKGKFLGNFGQESWYLSKSVNIRKIECKGDSNGAINPEPRRASLVLERNPDKKTYKLTFDNAGYYDLDVIILNELSCKFDVDEPLLVDCNNKTEYFSTYITNSVSANSQLDPREGKSDIFIKKFTNQLKSRIHNDEIINKGLTSDNLISINLQKNNCIITK